MDWSKIITSYTVCIYWLYADPPTIWGVHHYIVCPHYGQYKIDKEENVITTYGFDSEWFEVHGDDYESLKSWLKENYVFVGVMGIEQETKIPGAFVMTVGDVYMKEAV